MQQDVLISVIVPVYNSEKYLDRCLSSLLSQTFRSFEIVLINDASTDSSAKILERYQEKNKNVRVFTHQVNKRQGAARNTGIYAANGQYIAFVDSDDFVKPNYLEELYKTITQNDADIAYCNCKVFFDKTGVNFGIPFFARTRVLPGDKALKCLIFDMTIKHFICNKLYKKSLFWNNNLKFEENIFYEDVASTPRFFYAAEKVALTSKALCYYSRHNGTSISHMSYRVINDFLITTGVVREFLEEKGIYKKYKNVFNIDAYRVWLQNSFCIVLEHARVLKFKNLGKNLQSAWRSVRLFTSKNYKPAKQIPTLPRDIIDPLEEERLPQINLLKEETAQVEDTEVLTK